MDEQKNKSLQYTANDIHILQGLEGVRKKTSHVYWLNKYKWTSSFSVGSYR